MEYDPTNRGILIKDNENQGSYATNYSGSINIEGTTYYLQGRLLESNGKNSEIIAFEVISKPSLDDEPNHTNP